MFQPLQCSRTLKRQYSTAPRSSTGFPPYGEPVVRPANQRRPQCPDFFSSPRKNQATVSSAIRHLSEILADKKAGCVARISVPSNRRENAGIDPGMAVAEQGCGCRGERHATPRAGRNATADALFHNGHERHPSRSYIGNLEGADSGFIGQSLSQNQLLNLGGRPLSEEAVAVPPTHLFGRVYGLYDCSRLGMRQRAIYPESADGIGTPASKSFGGHRCRAFLIFQGSPQLYPVRPGNLHFWKHLMWFRRPGRASLPLPASKPRPPSFPCPERQRRKSVESKPEGRISHTPCEKCGPVTRRAELSKGIARKITPYMTSATRPGYSLIGESRPGHVPHGGGRAVTDCTYTNNTNRNSWVRPQPLLRQA